MRRCQKAETGKRRISIGGSAVTRPKPAAKSCAILGGSVMIAADCATAASTDRKDGRPRTIRQLRPHRLKRPIGNAGQIAAGHSQHMVGHTIGIERNLRRFRQGMGWQQNSGAAAARLVIEALGR